MAVAAVGKRRKRKSSVCGTAPKVKKVTKSVTGPPKTKKFGDKQYSLSSCSNTKAGATKVAEEARSKGKLARIVDGCVYTRNK